jgi:exoribonuclease R
LVRNGARREAGFYVLQRNLKGAEDRDMVLIKRLKGRSPEAGRGLPLAAVVKVLAVRFLRAVGTVEERDGRKWLVPYDAKTTLDVEVLQAEGLGPNEWVVVELDPPSSAGQRRRGRVVERLGAIDQPAPTCASCCGTTRSPRSFRPRWWPRLPECRPIRHPKTGGAASICASR